MAATPPGIYTPETLSQPETVYLEFNITYIMYLNVFEYRIKEQTNNQHKY